MKRPDAELLLLAEEHATECRLYLAYKCLREIKDQSLLMSSHHQIVKLAEDSMKLRDEFKKTDHEGWTKQGEKHGKYDTVIYYKVNPTSNAIVCRVETPIEQSLLVPLLAVLNESSLYADWMPRFRFPVKLGMSESIQLKQCGRAHQIVRVRIDMPPPFLNRECIQHAFAVDSIDEDQAIILRIDSMDTGEHYELAVDEVDSKYKRVDLEAGIMISQCSANHSALKNSKRQYDEPLLLISLIQSIDAHVAGVPMSLINFFNRTVLGSQWGSLLQVAQDVKDGKRPAHLEIIKEKQELYGWVEGRTAKLFENMQNEKND